ncbi:MAG TPA: carboxypeptidase regulatory-like domain-containing protein [Candidatus Sulfotelmatobacter sp.]|nr:carboxypeptidase regulatory-like domain-containing protein [Candidatus Sulfotelmatobacter sp.]
MKHRFILRSLLLVTTLVLLGTFCFAQEATIVGTVLDPSGAAVPNATITITNTDTGITRTITTSTDGGYVVPDLRIGRYLVKAVATGFKSGEQKDLILQVGDRLRVDFSLQVGSTQETITVEANAARVQTDTGEVSSVVSGQQITQLATNGRSVFSLEALTPGANSVQADFMVPTSAGSDFNVSFNGQRVSHNLWLIDGGEAADRGGGGGSDVLPSLDAISEFRTMTSNYSAEYGLSSAGTISMVIKSGTKQFHAAAYYFGRNDALDAQNYFHQPGQPTQELRLHDWGFNVGGPVSFHPSTSNPKTFFFFNMEWRRYIQSGLFNVAAPLASMYPDANGAGTGVVLPDTLSNGNATQVVVPSNITSLYGNCSAAVQATLVAGQPFPNNTIPACLVNANASALLGAGIFPIPTNNSTWKFIGGGKTPTTGKEEIVRIDHQFTDKFSVFGHWISDQALQTYGTTMWSGDNVPTVGNTFGNPSYHTVVHATYAINPNVLNEIAFNYNGNRINILPAGVFAQPSGFTEGANKIFSGSNEMNRIPDMNLSGSTNTHYTVNWIPWKNTADDYQIRDDVSWVKGAHQLKFGFGWALYKKAQDYFANTQGSFTFDGSATAPAGCDPSLPHTTCGLDYADFILGLAQAYGENAYKGKGHWNNISPSAYLQDNWRATHKLTLNLGLRWDGIPHTYEANNQQAEFFPSLYNPANAPIWANASATQIASNSPGLGPSPVQPLQGYQFYLNGMGIAGKNGITNHFADNAWWNFGPRLGFAYDVTGSGTTVIRGGYGVMYERIQGNDMYNGATNAPFGYSLNTNTVMLDNPHNTWTGSTITVPIVPSSVVSVNKNYPPSRVSQFSIGVERSIGAKAVASVSYVGSVDRNLSYWQELNTPPQGLLSCLQASSTQVATYCTGGVQPAFNTQVPYQGFTTIRMAYNGANSHYNSLQTELHGRVTRDLNLQVAYTYSKAVDPSSNNGGNGWDLNWVSNPYQGWQYDVGPSPLDRRHIAFVNFVYDIPLLRESSNHFLKSVVGGWQLSGIITMQSGPAINLGLSGNNVTSIFPGGYVANRPDLTGTISYPKKVDEWFNTSAFTFPGQGQWGNLGHFALTGPGRDNWNLSLFKSFLLSETRGSRFEFRAESFNTWNHTQFGGAGVNGGISTNLGAGDFGQLTGAFDPRVFQLGAKLIF